MHQVSLQRPIVVGRPASALRDLALLAKSGEAIPISMRRACWQGKALVALAALSFGTASGLAVAGVLGSLWAFPLSLLSLCATALLLFRGLGELLASTPPKPNPLAEEIALEEEVCALLSSRVEEGMVVLNEVWIPIPGCIQRCSHLLVGSAGIVLLLVCPACGEFPARDVRLRRLPQAFPVCDRVAFEMQRTLAFLIKRRAGKLRIARPELADLLVHAAVVVADGSIREGPTLVPLLEASKVPRWYETLPRIGGWALGWRFREVAASLAYDLRRLVILRPPVASLPRN